MWAFALVCVCVLYHIVAPFIMLTHCDHTYGDITDSVIFAVGRRIASSVLLLFYNVIQVITSKVGGVVFRFA